MKFFIKILLVLSLLLPLSSTAQDVVEHQGWQVANEGNWGSFWWKVDRSRQPIQGYYYYYIICYSNSYFSTMKKQYGKYDRASTYIEYPKITMWSGGNIVIPLQLNGALFDWENTQIAYFSYRYTNVNFTINFNAVYPFDYSLR